MKNRKYNKMEISKEKKGEEELILLKKRRPPNAPAKEE